MSNSFKYTNVPIRKTESGKYGDDGEHIPADVRDPDRPVDTMASDENSTAGKLKAMRKKIQAGQAINPTVGNDTGLEDDQ